MVVAEYYRNPSNWIPKLLGVTNHSFLFSLIHTRVEEYNYIYIVYIYNMLRRYVRGRYLQRGAVQRCIEWG